ncbi:MAG: oxygenase MpaB family protein [Micromonosporaceae bacterium]
MSVHVTAASSPTPEPTRLGPDSPLWKSAGDWRIYLMAPGTSLLQNMLPGVSAGIEQHSVAFQEPWDRIMRSIPQIQQGVFDPRMAERVREYHVNIKGVDAHGDRYHALSPELYFAAHAVFTYTAITVLDLFDHRLSDTEKAAYYDDCKVWYRSYGVSDRAMPLTWPEFEDYWARLTAEQMENTPVAAFLVDAYVHPMTYKPPRMPTLVWRLLGPLVGSHTRLLAAATIPPVCREHVGLRFNRADRIRFAALAATVRAVWRWLPERYRITPRARQAKQDVLRELRAVPER